jgi:hypothetical protein
MQYSLPSTLQPSTESGAKTLMSRLAARSSSGWSRFARTCSPVLSLGTMNMSGPAPPATSSEYLSNRVGAVKKSWTVVLIFRPGFLATMSAMIAS